KELIEKLGTDDLRVRNNTIDRLTTIGEPAVPGLVKALQRPDKRIRLHVAMCLREMGPKAKAAIPDLIATLKTDKDAVVRGVAASALGSIGPQAKAAVSALVKAVEK